MLCSWLSSALPLPGRSPLCFVSPLWLLKAAFLSVSCSLSTLERAPIFFYIVFSLPSLLCLRRNQPSGAVLQRGLLRPSAPAQRGTSTGSAERETSAVFAKRLPPRFGAPGTGLVPSSHHQTQESRRLQDVLSWPPTVLSRALVHLGARLNNPARESDLTVPRLGDPGTHHPPSTHAFLRQLWLQADHQSGQQGNGMAEHATEGTATCHQHGQGQQ